MRYELSDYEWSVIKPMFPNKLRRISPWTTGALSTWLKARARGEFTVLSSPQLAPCPRVNQGDSGAVQRRGVRSKSRALPSRHRVLAV
jgi:hypothetical protein